MVVRYVIKKVAMVWLLLAGMLAVSPAFAVVSAQVDRQLIGDGETVNLTIHTSGDDNGEPDTAPLEQDFEILSRNRGSSYTLNNGSMSRSANWQFILRPRQTGQLMIPPIQVGQVWTQPITVQVKYSAERTAPGGQPTGDIWLEMSVEPDTVLVQQQALINLKIYQAVAMSQAQLTDPKSDHAIIEQLGKDRQYLVMRNGRNWQVTERKYAVFPQMSGELVIAAAQLDAAVALQRQSFGMSIFQSSRPIRVHSNALKLSVKPIPQAWQGSNWLPSSSLTINEDWPTTETFKVGEPITRTLTLRAQGLSNSQLPALPSELPAHLKAYPDQPGLSDEKTDRGIVGIRREKTAIIPTAPGAYILPAITVRWWNVDSGKIETETVPVRRFKVVGALSPAPVSGPLQTQPRLPQAQPPTPASMSELPQVQQFGGWKMMAIVATIGWLLTLLFLLIRSTKRNRSSQVITPQSSGAENIKVAQKAIKAACKRNDAKACEQALIKYSAIRWPDANGGLRAWRACEDAVMNEQITLLEMHLYGGSKQPWDGNNMLTAFAQLNLRRADEKSAGPGQELPGLYPE